MSHNETPFEDAQYYRDEYIRNLDQQDDKTSFAASNASSLYALGLTMYSQTYSLDSLIYNAFAVSTLDSNIGLTSRATENFIFDSAASRTYIQRSNQFRKDFCGV